MFDSPVEGKLVRLRAREPEDEPRYHRWLNDADVTEHLVMRYPVSHAFERQWLEDDGGPTYEKAGFAIETRVDGQHVGSITLRDGAPELRTAILGIFIGEKSSWGGGYGTDAMRTICRFGFEVMNLHRIELDVYAENLRAVRVYEKVGFVAEACRRQANFQFGRYHDLLTMGLLEGELR
jgi:RimJ/RimL family protein N-acetyltransferase